MGTGERDASVDSDRARRATLAAISVRNLDDDVEEQLRIRAARHGRSMESEIRSILEEAVRESSDARGLAVALLDRFRDSGGVELDLPPRATPVRAADLAS